MLREALELVQETAVSAKGAQHLVDSADGRTKFYVLRGERFDINVGPPVREHLVASLDDLIDYAKGITEGGYSVWHSSGGVVLLCDHFDRRDRVTFCLLVSEPFAALTSLKDGGDRFSQFDFLLLLNRTLGVDASTVNKFRRLDFKVIQAAEGEYQHGKDRLGQSIQAEVKGTAELPEEISVVVPIYDSVGERALHTILCSVDLDSQRSQIIFRPKPMELSIAIENHQKTIHDRLVDALEGDTRIYCGSP